MANTQHGRILPTHAGAGGRGNHTVEGLPSVVDEAERATLQATYSLTIDDRGREVRQTAGSNPGWYRYDGAGGWERVQTGGVAAAPAAPEWAHSYWYGDSIAFNGSDRLTSWAAENGDNDDIAPTGNAPLAAPSINLTTGQSYLSGRFGRVVQGFRTDVGSAAALSATLTTPIAAASDLYLACYAHFLLMINNAGTLIAVNGGLGLGQTALNARLAWDDGAGHAADFDAESFSDAARRPGLWELIHSVGNHIDVFFDGRHMHRAVANVGARGTDSDTLSIGLDEVAALTSGPVSAQVSGVIVHNAIPSYAERESAALWMAGVR